MTLPADPQQQQLLEELQRAGDQPVAFSDLHAAGISFPAAVISELALDGYLVERVYQDDRLLGVHLLNPERIDRSSLRPWRRPWRRGQPLT